MTTMKTDDLDRLEHLAQAASPAPWWPERFDDDHCASAMGVMMRTSEGWHERVAATLIQHPDYVGAADDRWDLNAELIAECRNSLAELVRLARIGLAVG